MLTRNFRPREGGLIFGNFEINSWKKVPTLQEEGSTIVLPSCRKLLKLRMSESWFVWCLNPLTSFHNLNQSLFNQVCLLDSHMSLINFMLSENMSKNVL